MSPSDGPLANARQQRVNLLVGQAHDIYRIAIQDHIVADGRRHVATAVLFSGGNDSTVLAHMFRDVATHAIHANTTIGIEATRQFVRDTCRAWSLPLLEELPPPGCTYEDLILDQGFPGPAHHWKMYQRLKERGLHAARNRLIEHPWRQRVVFLAGRRRAESVRRDGVPTVERNRTIVWVSPLADWTALDMNTYRAMHPDCPRNFVSEVLHMSGECLCGAFARRGELDEIGEWFPEATQHIHQLETKVRAAGHPAEKCVWGWGADRVRTTARSGPLCTSCVDRVAP